MTQAGLEPQDGPRPFSGAKLVVATVVLSLANFMVVLDTTIANVSVPTISGDIGVTTTEGLWIVTSYAVAEAITIPLTGWLVSRFGAVKVFLTAIALFMIFSVLCGLAGSLQTLVVFRVFQGLAGGPMIPLSLTLLLQVFPRDKANIATALWGMTTVVAPIAGPVLGGLISDNLSWPWIFYINVPAGLVCVGVSWWLLRGRETPTSRNPIDVVGLALLIVWVASFQLMLDKGRELDWFASPFIVGCGLTFVVSAAIWVIWELTEEHPIVDLSVFRSRNWFVSTLTITLLFGLFFGNVVLTPLWLQTQMGYTATWAGYATAPMGVLAVISAPIVGRLLPKVDPRLMVTYGMCVIALAFLLRSRLTTQASYIDVAIPMLIIGAGVPASIVTLTSLGVSGLPADKVNAGAGLQNFFRVMSMAVGSSVAQTYWDHAAKVNRAELVDIVRPDAMADLVANAPPGAISEESSLQLFSNTLQGQAVMLATNDFYAWATLLMVVFAGFIWLAKPPQNGLAPHAGH